MEDLGNVQQKISCLFKTVVIEEVSSKRSHQPFKVVASEEIRAEAEVHHINNSLPSEKLDGTCVYVEEFQGRPWLWARFDRKPTKIADKKYKKFQAIQRSQQLSGHGESVSSAYQWDVKRDFKDVPENWIPAKGVEIKDGLAQPDTNGHIPGWVPLELHSRQYCWHLSTVDLKNSLALVLRPCSDDDGRLEITVVPLTDLVGTTLELIGTNVNANPYHLGSKQNPLHLLVRHGVVQFAKSPPLIYSDLKIWFEKNLNGKVEGIVWHCQNGTLFKLHRHHLGLPWPIEEPRICQLETFVNVNLAKFEVSFDEKSLFYKLGQLHDSTYSSIKNIM